MEGILTDPRMYLGGSRSSSDLHMYVRSLRPRTDSHEGASDEVRCVNKVLPLKILDTLVCSLLVLTTLAKTAMQSYLGVESVED